MKVKAGWYLVGSTHVEATQMVRKSSARTLSLALVRRIGFVLVCYRIPWEVELLDRLLHNEARRRRCMVDYVPVEWCRVDVTISDLLILLIADSCF